MPVQKLLAKIHIAKKQLGLDDETYRSMLKNLTGKQSAKDLTDRQIILVINHLMHKGWQPKAGPKKYDDLGKRDVYAASPSQLRLIEVLWHQVYRGNNETLHLRQFLFNHFKVSDIRFLDSRTSYEAVEALKKMNDRKLGCL